MRVSSFKVLIAAAVVAPPAAPAFGQDLPAGYARLWGNPENRYKRDIAPDEATARLASTIARTGNANPTGWLSPKDPAYVLMKRDPSLTARAELKIGFNGAGKMRSCMLVESSGSMNLTASLCDRIRPRARLTPPMRRDGKTLAETYTLYASFSGKPLPQVPMISPPLPPDVVPWPNGKPPAYVYLRLVPANIPPYFIDPGGIPPETPVTGVVVQVEAGEAKQCRIGKSSGDSAIDQQACLLALTSGYVWSYNGQIWAGKTSLPMLLIGKGSDMQALPPLTQAGSLPVLKDEARVELAAIAKANGGSISPAIVSAGVDQLGHAFDCWLMETSGSDRADLAICDFLMSGARFTPGKDIFTRNAERTIYRLKLGE
jgi:hypothetical protein